MIKNNNNQFAEETTYCNGANSIIKDQMYCVVPMSILIDPLKYDLDFQDLVEASVSAYNVNGWSDVSELNTIGATVRIIPDIMGMP